MPRDVLIVEDDADIAKLVQLQLKDIDCTSTIVDNGKEALQHLREHSPYDLLILDIMLPGCDGLAICREVRTAQRGLPILMLTAKSGELDRVLGLEMGADDYLTKPFSYMELSARVKALFRRVDVQKDPEPQVGETLRFGELTIDLRTRSVKRAEQFLELTAREFDLLVHFARHPGQVFTRSQLLDQVWGYCHEGYEHTVNTHINRLRGKIESQPESPEYIVTVWGVGYQFAQREQHRETATHAV